MSADGATWGAATNLWLDNTLDQYEFPAIAAEATWFYNRFDDLIVSVGKTFGGGNRAQELR